MTGAHDNSLASAIATHCYGATAQIECLSRYNNEVFRLRFSNGCKILKLAKCSQNALLRKELMLIDLLARHAVPVPVIEHEDGDARLVGRPFFTMDSAGERTVADWVGTGGDLGRRLFAEMGNVLARIHGVRFGESGEIQHDRIVPSHHEEQSQRVLGLAGWVVEQRLLGADEVAPFKSVDLPKTTGDELCHGDFHAVQCIVQRDRIAAVVDWESAWAGNSVIDLAIVHAYLDYYCPPELIACFFAGYAAIRPIPPDYDEAYRLVRMAHVLGLLKVWHSRRHRQNVKRAIDLYRAYSRKGKC
jgi:Ser/Thr protein kinase RdoA (MazF antagonist)